MAEVKKVKIDDWINEYKKGVEEADWEGAAANWENTKEKWIPNYTGVEGLNPVIAKRYEKGVSEAKYKIPDITKMVAGYERKMKKAK